jgi:hypothetical protein
MITFIIGGLWHGAGWTFVFWGFMHGSALIIHRVWKNLGFRMNSILAWFITFNFINIAWVFFRAKEWNDAIKVLKGMFGFNGLVNQYAQKLSIAGEHVGAKTLLYTIGGSHLTLQLLIISFLLIFFGKNSYHYIQGIKFTKKTLFLYAFMSSIALLSLNNMSEFLYFNF